MDVQPLDGQQHYRDCDVIKEWIENFQVRDVEVVCNQAVQVFKDLKSIFSSQCIRPDVVVYWKEIPVLVIEVHSSPYERTLTDRIDTDEIGTRTFHVDLLLQVYMEGSSDRTASKYCD